MSELRDLNRFIVRMPEGMRDALKRQAAENRRSTNSEIVLILERALRGEQAATEGTLPGDASAAANRHSALQGAATTNG
jgi:hypothetical protein